MSAGDTNWLPPRERPWNESAGYVGYYTRTYLGEKFDLIDFDGAWPAVWLYYQANGRTLRVIEEKPGGQQLHTSQLRGFAAFQCVLSIGVRTGAFSDFSGVYTIYEVDKLAKPEPEFPITVERFRDKQSFAWSRDEFDAWLLLQESPVEIQHLEAA